MLSDQSSVENQFGDKVESEIAECEFILIPTLACHSYIPFAETVIFTTEKVETKFRLFNKFNELHRATLLS